MMVNNEYDYQDWLTCPNCGSENVGARDYHTELIFECYECDNQRVMFHGKHRPLSHADPDRIKERLKRIRKDDEEAKKSWWAESDENSK
jgi:hypothetical protein